MVLVNEAGPPPGGFCLVPEDPDEYRALSIFWVPPEARWQHLKAQARQACVRVR